MSDDIKTVTLHLERYVASHLMDWPFANDPRLSVDHAVEYAGALLLTLMQDVLIQRELLAEYPSTWWDAFKLRFFPAWALRRWPAVMNRIDGEILYPMIAIPHYRKGVTLKMPHYIAHLDSIRKTYTKDFQ